MSATMDPRRERRRRLAITGNQSATEAVTPPAEQRAMADYAAEADPERLPGPATLLPTGLGRFALVAGGLVTVVTATAVAGAWEPLTGRPLFVASGRFRATLALSRECLDLRLGTSVAGWLAQLCLALASGVALVVRLMRRHRRDDFNGRFRAWGWMAALLAVAACDCALPLGRLCGLAAAEASGITLGPGGIGWWYLLAVAGVCVIVPWAVLPLHERGLTAAWLLLGLTAWGVAAGCGWLGVGEDKTTVAGHAAWSLGCGLVAVAMLAAARSVIREVRGQCGSADSARSAREWSAGRGTLRAESSTETLARRAVPGVAPTPTVADETDATAEDSETAFIDGSESAARHLSKAERKRLRKLARMQQAA